MASAPAGGEACRAPPWPLYPDAYATPPGLAPFQPPRCRYPHGEDASQPNARRYGH
jgi:hypothetical protein